MSYNNLIYNFIICQTYLIVTFSFILSFSIKFIISLILNFFKYLEIFQKLKN